MKEDDDKPSLQSGRVRGPGPQEVRGHKGLDDMGNQARECLCTGAGLASSESLHVPTSAVSPAHYAAHEHLGSEA